MEKEIRYFVSHGGLYFSFDFAERYSKNEDRLIFRTSDGLGFCQLDLNVSRLIFSYKNDSINTYYFEIVPVGGVSDGK